MTKVHIPHIRVNAETREGPAGGCGGALLERTGKEPGQLSKAA